MTWNLETMTIAEAEALFAEPLPDPSTPDDPPAFCEPELIAVYRRHLKNCADQLQECADKLQAVHGPALDPSDRRGWADDDAFALYVDTRAVLVGAGVNHCATCRRVVTDEMQAGEDGRGMGPATQDPETGRYFCGDECVGGMV